MLIGNLGWLSAVVVHSFVGIYLKCLRERLATNKRFKTDSQRVAFLLCVDFSGLGDMRQHRIALLTT
ncbi:DUF3265 domain-containing protein [Vibrio parahaemolyticus]|nr:DUF3265 domain-containing protein [Vibrio parahaemolyticus]